RRRRYSVPTRRSSDLEADPEELLPDEPRGQQRAPQAEAPGAFELGEIRAAKMGPDFARRPRVAHAEERLARRKNRHADEGREEPDRKSTRLNSSHLGI